MNPFRNETNEKRETRSFFADQRIRKLLPRTRLKLNHRRIARIIGKRPVVLCFTTISRTSFAHVTGADSIHHRMIEFPTAHNAGPEAYPPVEYRNADSGYDKLCRECETSGSAAPLRMGDRGGSQPNRKPNIGRNSRKEIRSRFNAC